MFSRRLYLFFCFFSFCCLVVISRLFYWQIVRGDELAALAQRQRLQVKEISAPRGKIYTANHHPLVLNEPGYSVYIYTPNTNLSNNEIAESLGPILDKPPEELEELISGPRKWLVLSKNISPDQKKEIEQLEISGVGFEAINERDYPEASMSAHVLGFVGRNKNDRPQGYFGLEGFYHQQLSGKGGLIMGEKNPFGQSIFLGQQIQDIMEPGYDLILNIERTAQYILEDELKKGIEKHQAESGWAVILDPNTGRVLAMASFPNYSPKDYAEWNEAVFSNPIVASGFEPGSIFKPLIMASALEEDLVAPETVCPVCDGRLTIGDDTIRTFNDQYHPNSTMTEVIKNSDNVGMAYVAGLLGKEKVLDYLQRLGFGQKTGIDLQEEATFTLRTANKWYPIDVATAGFGQGISITPIQFVRAFSALANGGYLVDPQVVKEIRQVGDKSYQPTAVKGERVFSEQTCESIRDMMVLAVEQGATEWIDKNGISAAGKTGTAQIPIEGHYDEEKTIGSFVGYFPAEEPKFVMLVSLREPKSSPWGADTAAPVWFEAAKRLSYYWNLK